MSGSRGGKFSAIVPTNMMGALAKARLAGGALFVIIRSLTKTWVAWIGSLRGAVARHSVTARRFGSLVWAPGRATAYFLWKCMRFAPRLAWTSAAWTVKILVVALIFIFAIQVFAVTPRDIAYRYAGPRSEACVRQREVKTILADIEVNNNERALVQKRPDLVTPEKSNVLTCMLQEHEIPPLGSMHWPFGSPVGPIRYHLAFLEYMQDGRPAERGPVGQAVGQSQLDVLKRHLEQQSRNFVIFFIHGWRHDASIGDENVKDLRLYASHAAAFLDYRCKIAGRYCDTTVTAVFVGWRGARVNENKMKAALGETLGGWVGTTLAAPTLFDRKPVSEQIGPAAVSALAEIDKLLKGRNIKRPPNSQFSQHDRMLIIGHSLGGNMLASALRETYVDKIRNHSPKQKMQSPLGDLVVLLNPASEASNWTAIQRAMREKVAFEGPLAELEKSHRFFRRDQPPIYISLTSAYRWPIAYTRPGDYSEEAAWRKAELRSRVDYDWATHDLFPAFKFDFRPWADSMQDSANYYREGGAARPGAGSKETDACISAGSLGPICREGVRRVLMVLAMAGRNIPFMNTASEETRTIGHLNPMRPAFGQAKSYSPTPATRYGTTHEFLINQDPGHDTQYLNSLSPFHSECNIVDHWLWRAKKREPPYGTFWDSGLSRGTDAPARRRRAVEPRLENLGTKYSMEILPNLTPARARKSTKQNHVESQFRHGYHFGGMGTIVRANDPFWNVRAFDTALRAHDGYVSYPLICAIHQLVLDDIASEPEPELP